MDLARRTRHGNALILVLGIALLLAIQIYIIQTLTVGSFRHVEKVNALIRAIYVGEAAFSQILAKIKVDKWEKHTWFLGRPDGYRDFGQTLAGGTFSSVVVEVPVPAGTADKLVDVWLEARYEGSTQVMFYRVLYADDTLDFTAQVYPRFFTFLEANDPNPFTGALGPATVHIQDLIDKQVNNEPAAIAAINGVRTTCNLSGVTSSLGVSVPGGSALDTLTPPGGSPLDLCTYVSGTLTTLTGIVPPPPALPLPTIPPNPAPPGDFINQIQTQFTTAGYGPLPTNPSGRISATPGAALLSDPAAGDDQWRVEHQQRNYEHYMKDDEMLGLIGNMLDKRDAAPGTPEAIAINTIVGNLLNFVSTASTAAGGPAYTAPTGAKAEYITAFRASQADLPDRDPTFAEKPK